MNKGSITRLREAVRLEPGNAAIRFALGRFLFEHEQFAEAEVLLRECTKLAPGNPNYHVLHGQALSALGRHEVGADGSPYRYRLGVDEVMEFLGHIKVLFPIVSRVAHQVQGHTDAVRWHLASDIGAAWGLLHRACLILGLAPLDTPLAQPAAAG